MSSFLKFKDIDDVPTDMAGTYHSVAGAHAKLVRDASLIVQSLLGYSIYAPFLGNVNGLSPLARARVATAALGLLRTAT